MLIRRPDLGRNPRSARWIGGAQPYTPAPAARRVPGRHEDVDEGWFSGVRAGPAGEHRIELTAKGKLEVFSSRRPRSLQRQFTSERILDAQDGRVVENAGTHQLGGELQQTYRSGLGPQSGDTNAVVDPLAPGSLIALGLRRGPATLRSQDCRAPLVISVWAFRFFCHAVSPAPGSIGCSLP